MLHPGVNNGLQRPAGGHILKHHLSQGPAIQRPVRPENPVAEGLPNGGQGLAAGSGERMGNSVGVHMHRAQGGKIAGGFGFTAAHAAGNAQNQGFICTQANSSQRKDQFSAVPQG